MPTCNELIRNTVSVAFPIVGGAVGGIANGPEEAVLGGVFGLALGFTVQVLGGLNNPGIKSRGAVGLPVGKDKGWYAQLLGEKKSVLTKALNQALGDAEAKKAPLVARRTELTTAKDEIVSRYHEEAKRKARSLEGRLWHLRWNKYIDVELLTQDTKYLVKEIKDLNPQIKEYDDIIDGALRTIAEINKRANRLLELTSTMAQISVLTPDHKRISDDEDYRAIYPEYAQLRDYFGMPN